MKAKVKLEPENLGLKTVLTKLSGSKRLVCPSELVTSSKSILNSGRVNIIEPRNIDRTSFYTTILGKED